MKKILDTAALFDTSVLVPLVFDKHLHYQQAKDFLELYLRENRKIIVSSQSVLEISTVLSGQYKIAAGQVSAIIRNFIFDPMVTVIYPNPESVNKYLDLLRENPGNYFTDLFLASTALSAGCETIITNDRDFEKIKGIKVYNPFV